MTGKSYDIKASLMDYSARWYSPSVGRFTTQDTWTGLGDLPQTLNRYAYALNNPINITDPSGHAPCYEDDNGNLRCGYSPNPDDWGNRGGGNGGGGSSDDVWTPPAPLPPPNPDELEPPPLPEWMNKDSRIATLLEKAGVAPQEISMMFQLLSAGVDSIPVLGNIKSAVEAITGYNIITGEKLGFLDRAVSGLTALIPGGGALKNALQAGMKTAKVLDKAVTLERRLDDVPRGCGNCFTAGTLVETETGKKPIEEIDVGDKVLSKDDATGKLAYKEVNGTFQRDAEEIYTIQVGDQKLTTTGEHPFYVHSHGWVRTKNLKVGDQLDTASGMTLEVKDIQVKQETTRVYNFSVTDYHSYFVSDLRIWTHNTEVCPVVDKYGVLRKDKSTKGQAHHLNQDAAYKKVIPTKEGMSVKLDGNAFTDKGSPHYSAHQILEQFWDQYRPNGSKFGEIPTNTEYTKAMVDSLKVAGYSKNEAMQIAEKAIQQRVEYGLLGGQPVPNIPGKINQKK